MDWLIGKCPKLQALSLWSRTEHELSWLKRRMMLDYGPRSKNGSYVASRLGLWKLGHCKHLRYLNVAGCTDLQGVPFALVASSCRGLEILDASGSDLRDSSMDVLAEYCPRLRRVNLSCCTDITDAGIRQLVKGCRQLQRIDLCKTSVTDAGITAIANHCAELRHLDAAFCVGMTDASLSLLARRCKDRLEHLGLEGCRSIGDEGMLAVAENCPSLRRLDIGAGDGCSSRGITEASLSVLARRCTQLAYLRAPYAGQQLRSEPILAMAGHWGQLQHLNLSRSADMTDRAVQAIVRHCRALRELYLSWCYSVTDGGVAPLARHGPPGLRALKLSGTQVTDASVVAIAAHCRQLRRFHLGYTGITAQSLLAVAQHCPALESLSVENCQFDMDDALAAIGRGCPHFQVLRAKRCRMLSDEAIIRLVRERGAQMQELCLCESRVTDAGLEAVGGACARLRKLHVASCGGVTDVGVAAVVAGCGQLEVCGVEDCAGVTEGSYTLLQSRSCQPMGWIFRDERFL
eukprot:jgi/Mesvir1/17524/Mv08778-RA.1